MKSHFESRCEDIQRKIDEQVYLNKEDKTRKEAIFNKNIQNHLYIEVDGEYIKKSDYNKRRNFKSSADGSSGHSKAIIYTRIAVAVVCVLVSNTRSVNLI